MNNTENKKITRCMIVLIFISIFAIFILLLFGRFRISVSTIIQFCLFQPIDEISYNVLLYLRLYRLIISFFIGSSLSLSGLIYQDLFNNVLVSPDILGVSSGASVGACFAILLGLSSLGIVLFSFVFAVLSLLMCLYVSKFVKYNFLLSLILSGIAVSGLMSSVVGLFKYLADSEKKLYEMTFWLLGDLSKTSNGICYYFIPLLILCIAFCVKFSWKLNILSLGKKESLILGIDYSKYAIMFIVVATIMTAISVSTCGVVSWIGLVVPNICRLVAGNDNKKIVPISIFVGGIFLMVSDTIARSIAPNEIPVSVVTGIFGTLLFIYILTKHIKYDR